MAVSIMHFQGHVVITGFSNLLSLAPNSVALGMGLLRIVERYRHIISSRTESDIAGKDV